MWLSWELRPGHACLKPSSETRYHRHNPVTVVVSWACSGTVLRRQEGKAACLLSPLFFLVYFCLTLSLDAWPFPSFSLHVIEKKEHSCLDQAALGRRS